MLAKHLKSLRVTVIIFLVLLAIQLEFGMAVNLSDLPSLSPFSLSLSNLLGALDQAGAIALIHASLGTILTILSVASLIMSLVSRIRSVQVVGVLSCLTTILAEANGILFVLSGFQNDNYSHGMATGFILTFGLFFLELYFLKPMQRAK